jgi:hypothetical protein
VVGCRQERDAGQAQHGACFAALTHLLLFSNLHLPHTQVYSSRIASLESAVLLEARPQASLTKELHLLSNDLKRELLALTRHDMLMLLDCASVSHAPCRSQTFSH